MAEHLNPILGRETEICRFAAAPEPWQLAKCVETDFVFLLNPPSYEEVATTFAWEKSFVEEAQARSANEPLVSFVSEQSKRFRSHFFRRRDKVFQLARRDLPNKQSLAILDVGSGSGNRAIRFCENLNALGREAVPSGIEISPAMARKTQSTFARLGGTVVNQPALEGIRQLEPESFDIVIMSCYLEHECRPLDVLRHTHSVLHDDGYILVKVPNFDSINRKVRGNKWCGYRFPDHVNYFTPATLRILAHNAGFEIVPPRWSDSMPTSDNMYAVLRKRSAREALKVA